MRRGAAVRILAVMVIAAAALELSVLECFLLPLRAGGTPLPVSIVLVVVGNAALPLLAARATGSRAVALLPVVIWVVVVLWLAVPRTEGDLIVDGRVGNLIFLVLGVLAAAFAMGRIYGRAAVPSSAGRSPATVPPAGSSTR